MKWLLDWIETKYKIWRFNRKHGVYSKKTLSVADYEYFYVSETDKQECLDLGKPRFTIVQESAGVFGFLFKTKI